MSMSDHVERYVAFKRHMGFQFEEQARLLGVYARHAEARGELFTRNDTMIGWAAEARSPAGVYHRLGELRRLANWLHAEDKRHEVPPRHLPGRNMPRRPAPYVMTRHQIGLIMQTALTLEPAGSIRPHTYHCMFGLMAVTGLRRSEAVNLRLSDITPDGLIVRKTKFRKSRLVPLHVSTREALGRYLRIRNGANPLDDHLFIGVNGRSPAPHTVTQTFVKLARRTGMRGPVGERGGPRLHDLRHSFCVRSLEAAIETDRDSVNRHMLALTTYVGHTYVSSTYWYLEATPTLLRQVADVAENAHMGRACR